MLLGRSTETLAEGLLTQPPASNFLLCPAKGPLTFEQVVRRVGGLGQQIAALGIQATDRVVLVGSPGLDLTLATLALCCHCCCLPVAANSSAADLRHLLSAVNASALAYVGDLPEAAGEACNALAVPRLALDTQREFAGDFGARVSPTDLALILPTSGTTARPRLVPLQHRQLCMAARRIVQALELTSSDICLQMLPLCHIHGLSTLLSTMISGGTYVCCAPFEVQRFFQHLGECEPTWFSAAPAHYAMLLESQGSPARIESRLRLVRSASASMPLDLWRSVEDFFQCPLLQAYGLTEAAPQVASNTFDSAGRRPGSVGRPLGLEVQIVEGEIWIRGEQVCAGYFNQTGQERQRFRDGWLATGDLGFFDEDGFLFVTGRAAEVINRGGEKISPQRIEAVLAQHPLIESAVSFAVPHPTLGQNVGAAVVLKPTGGIALDRVLAEIRQFASASLPAQQIPQHWRVVQQLPLGPGGKVQRSRLSEESPTDLARLWGEVLGKVPNGPDANFFEMGGHSLSAARLLQRIEERYGVQLPLDSLFLHPTLGQLEQAMWGQPVPGFRLNPGQRRLWFLEQLHPEQATYNLATPLWLEGPLEIDRLRRAVTGLCQRHQALRLRLQPLGDFPCWQDSQQGEPLFQVCEDWLTPEEALKRARAAAARPFHLLQEPLFVAYLWKVNPERHLLLLVQHHMLSDGWSVQLLLRDLADLYAQKELAPAGSFTDYTGQLEGLHELGLPFWKQQLQPPPPALRLFVDRSACDGQSTRGGKVPFALGPGSHRRLEHQARHWGVTPFVLILAAFQVCLASQSGSLDFLVGVAQAGRPDASSEGVVGFFANTLPVRSDLVRGESFRHLTGRVQLRLQQALRYPQVALEKLGAPVQVMLAYQNFPQASPQWPEGLQARPFKLDNGTAKFELTLYLWEREGSLQGEWQYPLDRLQAPRLQALTRHWGEVLDAMLDRPDAPWDAKPSWLERFLQQARRAPQSLALVCGEEYWSYLELERQSAQLASFLQHKGLGRGHLVALQLPRGPDLVVAILGVLRSGAAYLPVDPGYPEERVRQMLALCPVDFTLGPGNFPDLHSQSPFGELSLAEDSRAYVMFTSGSGGTPKAVPLSHGNLNHYLGALPLALGLSAQDRYLHTASFSFSSSVRQLLAPLVSGATVVLASAEEVADPELLWRRVQQSKVTIVDLIPSYSQRLLDTRPCPQAGLRLLLSASEPLPVALAQGWSQLMGSQLGQINMYGQTETCGIVCLHAVSGQESGPWMPLGRPLPGIHLELLEDGEIALDGATLFAGYVGEGPRPPGGYRSGDLGALDADGVLHFRGRKDRQLKTRGVRVEPAEIEACLNQHPWVLECKVGATHDQRLVAQVVLRAEHCATERQLRRSLRTFLQARLPAALVPHRYVQVDRLQRSPSGKLVRHSGGEDGLEQLWKEVLQLGTEGVEHDDNFFESGGDSILSLTFVQALARQGYTLGLADLFRFPTFGEIRQRVLGQLDSRPLRGGLRRFPIEDLRDWSIRALTSAGLRRDVAETVAEVQLEASLRGQSTHALDSIPRYAQRLRQGRLNPNPEPVWSQVTDLSALLEGDNGPGQWVATLAMEKAIEKARQHGIGLVSVRGSNHFGAAGHYAWMALQAGLIGICTSNGPLILAPTGGVEPCFGNNPLAVGIPAGRERPILLDIAMSVAPRGKIGLQLAQGEALPEGWILDQQGRASVDPADLVAGLGVPIGGHKGYGLALVFEVLSALLSGAGFGSSHLRSQLRNAASADIGHFFLALDPALFGSAEAFSGRVEQLISQVKGCRRAAGVGEILLPGESELRERERSLREGVGLSPATLANLEKHARRYGIPLTGP